MRQGVRLGRAFWKSELHPKCIGKTMGLMQWQGGNRDGHDMIWFVFLQNYSGFWLEKGLTETAVVAVGCESRGLAIVQARGKGGLDQGGDSDCGENWRDSRYALQKWQNLKVLCGGVVRRGRCQG